MNKSQKLLRERLKNKFFLITLCIMSSLTVAATVRAASQEAPQPLVAIFESDKASLAEILGGKDGEVYLVYYWPEKGIERPSLVVRLAKETGAVDSMAEVYDVPPDEDHVPVEYGDGHPILPGSLIPTITITALGGWWHQDGIVNFDLDIYVNGPVMTMWASDGTTGWARFIGYGKPNARILVRDRNGDGLADWDWRTMLPEFPNRGDYRTTYAERKCDSPVRFEDDLFPAWPFVAGNNGYGYEQLSGVFRPPIVVDWGVGRVQTLSEIVTLRNQNCSYGMHSIKRVLPDQLNSPDFEIPFAFYDLSGNGQGYPDLIIRTGRTILDADAAGLATKQMQVIRYSWSNENVGDGTMDYKVEVFGFHPFKFKTPIADGKALIDAPPYELYPGWVISKLWPAVTFNSVENRAYRTSEGIYEWAPGSLGSNFYLGVVDQGDITAFSDITKGMRGEYRLNTDHQTELYMSPIDNRLHLKWAEHGIWRLDDEQIIRVTNLDEDGFIDVWSRETMPATLDMLGMPLGEETENDETPVEPEVIEALYALDNYLLHDGSQTVTLKEADYQPALFETLPPTDHDTWEAHRALLAPYEDQRRDPTDLRSWLGAFSGPRSEITGASVANVRITDDGFRFELALEPGMQVAGTDLLGLGDLPAGQYVVENRDGVFHVAPMAPAQLTIDVQPPAVSGVTQITVGNSGTADATDLELIVEVMAGDKVVVELSREPVDARAGEMARQLVTIPSNMRAGYYLSARLEDSVGETVVVSRPLSLAGPAAEHTGEFTLSRIPVLIPVLGSFSVLLALAALLAVMRRGRQFDI